MPETRQEVRNGREPRVPAPAWDNSPPSGRSAAVAYLLWEQVVAGSIPAAPTKPSRELARDLRPAGAPASESAGCGLHRSPDLSLRSRSRGARLLRSVTSRRLLAPRPRLGPTRGVRSPEPGPPPQFRLPLATPRPCVIRFVAPNRGSYPRGLAPFSITDADLALQNRLRGLECARFGAEKGDASQEV